MLLAGRYTRVQLFPLRMAFSQEMGQVGRFGWGKVGHLILLVLRALWLRQRHQIDTLYYPPSGGDRVPLARDLLILLCLRPFFPQVILHFHADGLTERYTRMRSPFLRALWQAALGEATLGLKVAHGSNIDLSVLRARQGAVLYNAAETPTALPQPHAKDKLRLLFVGALTETKGVGLLLEAFASLAVQHPSWQLHFVGEFIDPAFAAQCHQATAQLPDPTQVVWHGRQTGDAKAQLFADADIFCFPSFYARETFGLVVAEAMSYGLPVITTDWKGLPEVALAGATALIVRPRDLATLQSAITQLAHDEPQRRQLGQAGQARYAAHFSIARFHTDFEAIVAEALDMATR